MRTARETVEAVIMHIGKLLSLPRLQGSFLAILLISDAGRIGRLSRAARWNLRFNSLVGAHAIQSSDSFVGMYLFTETDIDDENSGSIDKHSSPF